MRSSLRHVLEWKPMHLCKSGHGRSEVSIVKDEERDSGQRDPRRSVEVISRRAVVNRPWRDGEAESYRTMELHPHHSRIQGTSEKRTKNSEDEIHRGIQRQESCHREVSSRDHLDGGWPASHHTEHGPMLKVSALFDHRRGRRQDHRVLRRPHQR